MSLDAFAEAWPIILLLTVPLILEPCHFHMHHFPSLFNDYFIRRALNQEQSVSTPVFICGNSLHFYGSANDCVHFPLPSHLFFTPTLHG